MGKSKERGRRRILLVIPSDLNDLLISLYLLVMQSSAIKFKL
jgi:hypothetical protein